MLVGCLFAHLRPVCQLEACLPVGNPFTNWRHVCQLNACLPIRGLYAKWMPVCPGQRTKKQSFLSFDCFSLAACACQLQACTVCFLNASYMLDTHVLCTSHMWVTCQSHAPHVTSRCMPVTYLVGYIVLHAMFGHAVLSLNAALVLHYVTASICCTQHLRHSNTSIPTLNPIPSQTSNPIPFCCAVIAFDYLVYLLLQVFRVSFAGTAEGIGF